MAYFNSTMVRLKAFGVASMVSLFEFQFHYGTIKSADYYHTFVSRQ